MNVDAITLIGQPSRWIVCFDRSPIKGWWGHLTGKYKHVRAFGYAPELDIWIFYDVRFSGTVIGAARGDAARAIMYEWSAQADLIGIEARAAARPGLAFYCVPAIRHLIGLPGSTLPLTADGLYRSCLAHGGVPIDESRPAEASSRSDVYPIAGQGAQRRDCCNPAPVAG